MPVFILISMLLLRSPALAAERSKTIYPWPIRSSFSVMNTLSTLQFYGPTPGFHHGLDLRAPAGTQVYAPMGGRVSVDNYYPPRPSSYTYRVVIEAEDGYRWEFHHVDPGTIPPEVMRLAEVHATVTAGTLLAGIYDASALQVPPHLHIDVIDAQGVHHNPLRFLPPLQDDTPPVIRGIYLVNQDNKAVAQASSEHALVAVPPGRYELVADVADIIPPESGGDSIYGMDAFWDGALLGSIRFDRLPDKDYLQGVTSTYRTRPFLDLAGKVVDNQVERGALRNFLVHLQLDASQLPASGTSVPLEVHVHDYAGNKSVLRIAVRSVFGPKFLAPKLVDTLSGF